MPKNKSKLHFLVAADDSGNFYRAYTEDKARRVAAKEDKDIYYLQNPLGVMKWHYGAFNNAVLLANTMDKSPALRIELIDLIIDRFYQKPEKRAEIVDTMREMEKDVRLGNLTMDADEALFEKHGDDYEDSLTYRDLRAMPRDCFREEPSRIYRTSVEAVTSITKCLEAVDNAFNVMGDEDGAKKGVKRILDVPSFDVDILIRLASELDIGFGDRDYDDDYGRFEGEPHYGECYFDVRDAVMRHWGELDKRMNAREELIQTFAFAVGEAGRANRAIYLEGNFVREHGKKLEL